MHALTPATTFCLLAQAGDYKAALHKYRKSLRYLDRAWESKELEKVDGGGCRDWGQSPGLVT